MNRACLTVSAAELDEHVAGRMLVFSPTRNRLFDQKLVVMLRTASAASRHAVNRSTAYHTERGQRRTKLDLTVQMSPTEIVPADRRVITAFYLADAYRVPK